MTSLLVQIFDSFEKLDVVVQLYRANPRPMSAGAVGEALHLSSESVRQALSALHGAGLVCRDREDDDAQWWFDATGPWAAAIEVLVDLYEIDRAELLAFMKHVVLHSFRTGSRRTSMFAFLRRRSRTRTPQPMN